MTNADEEQRAQLARDQAVHRLAATRERAAALAGDPTAAAALRAAWQPVLDAQRDAGDGAR